MNSEEPIVFVVDDDASTREALSRLSLSIGMRVQILCFGGGVFGLQAAGRARHAWCSRCVCRD